VELKKRYPLSEQRLVVAHAWQRADGVRTAAP
jgi:hypothetical protein